MLTRSATERSSRVHQCPGLGLAGVGAVAPAGAGGVLVVVAAGGGGFGGVRRRLSRAAIRRNRVMRALGAGVGLLMAALQQIPAAGKPLSPEP